MLWEFFLKHTPLFYFTQSLWTDEAFSILAAEKPLAFILPKLGFEPPFYYALLHFWIKIFGRSEIAVRSLSLLGFVLATIIVIKWGEKLFHKHWLSWFLPIFFFLNPMLLYYSFEVRTYGWYIFFATLSLYAYTEKRWILLTVANTLAFYNHAYALIVIGVEFIHWILTNRHILLSKSVRHFIKEPMIKSCIVVSLLISPWLIKIFSELGRLKHSWYFPVDFQLVKSVLGNMFLGYEGTPWYLWKYTATISVVLFLLTLLALRDKTHRKRNLLFFFMVYIPLFVVIGISFKKSIFVNRYLLPVTIGEIFLVTLALQQISNPMLQRLSAIVSLMFIVSFNIWYPDKHPKINIRSTMTEVNELQSKNDVVLAQGSLVYFGLKYYSKTPDRVFLYNPDGYAFPWYVGDAIFNDSDMAQTLPPYPIRAFIVNEKGEYYMAYDTEITFTKPKTALPTKRKP